MREVDEKVEDKKIDGRPKETSKDYPTNMKKYPELEQKVKKYGNGYQWAKTEPKEEEDRDYWRLPVVLDQGVSGASVRFALATCIYS